MRGAEQRSQGDRRRHNEVCGLQYSYLQEGPGGSVRRVHPEIALRQDPQAAAEGQAAGEDQEAIALLMRVVRQIFHTPLQLSFLFPLHPIVSNVIRAPST